MTGPGTTDAVSPVGPARPGRRVYRVRHGGLYLTVDTEGVDPAVRPAIERMIGRLAHHVPRWVDHLTIATEYNTSEQTNIASSSWRHAEDGWARLVVYANFAFETPGDQYLTLLHELGHLHQAPWFTAFDEALDALREAGREAVADVILSRRARAAEAAANAYAAAAGAELARHGVITWDRGRRGRGESINTTSTPAAGAAP